MKSSTITAVIALVVLLATVALYRQFISGNQDGIEPGQESQYMFVSAGNEKMTDDETVSGSEADSSSATGNTERAQATARAMKELKEKMADDGVDFAAAMNTIEKKLTDAPDGKLSEKEIISVLPPEHAGELLKIINQMYYPGTINTEEDQR